MEGYAKMALLMGEFPEFAIFRRFGALNAQNLLYLQAELKELENSLRSYALDDHNSGHSERMYYSKDWFTLKESCDASSVGANGDQWSTMLAIRQKLKEYNAALLQQSQVTRLQGPNHRELSFLQRWMARTEMGNVYLVGEDSDIWSDPDLPDLVALNEQVPGDPLSTWVSDVVIHWYHQIVGKRFTVPKDKPHHKNTVHYDKSLILRLTRLITLCLSCLLPVGSIVALSLVTSQPIRLWIVAIFVTLFSTTLGLVTSANISNIFTATSTFAAVLVVFIGTTGACACTSTVES